MAQRGPPYWSTRALIERGSMEVSDRMCIVTDELKRRRPLRRSRRSGQSRRGQRSQSHATAFATMAGIQDRHGHTSFDFRLAIRDSSCQYPAVAQSCTRHSRVLPASRISSSIRSNTLLRTERPHRRWLKERTQYFTYRSQQSPSADKFQSASSEPSHRTANRQQDD